MDTQHRRELLAAEQCANNSEPPSIGAALAFACLFLIAVELALQIRGAIRHGWSVSLLDEGVGRYVVNERLGIRTLRPSATIGGAEQVIKTNRYGLRGAEYAALPRPDQHRIALLGASTIQGAYARTNDETSSAILERLLNRGPSKRVEVINAGLDGLTIRHQVRLLRGLLIGLGIKTLIWYPGTNDIGCVTPRRSSGETARIRLPWLSMPTWVATDDIIIKNTAWVRSSNAPANQTLLPAFDVAGAKAAIEQGVLKAKKHGVNVVLVTTANSYRPGMSAEETAHRAQAALFFRPCYNGMELSAAVQHFNDMLREVATAHMLLLVDAEKLMPPDIEHYGDSHHFSPEGEEQFARVLFDAIGR